MKKTPSVFPLTWLNPLLLLSLFPLVHLCDAATFTWTNSSSGNWSSAANWNPNAVPGPGDSAVITSPGTYTVTLDMDATLDSLTLGGVSGTQSLLANSRSLVLDGVGTINSNGITLLVGSTLAGTGRLTNQGTLNADSSAINTALVNQGLLVFRGNAGLGGSVDNQAGATLRVQADGGYAGTATLTVASGFTNNGKLELTSAVDIEQAALNLNSGTLVNGAGGQINVLAGTGGGRVLGVELDNRGTVTIDQGLTLNGSSAHHLNSGTITLGSGNFTVEQNGPSPSFTTTGAISIGAGQTFTVSGGTFNYNTGTVGGAGTLRLSSTTANSTPNLSNALTTLQLNGATLNGPGSVINAVGKTLNADSSAINTALVNQGLLVFRGNAGLGGSVDNQAGATLRVQADGGYAGTATLTVASGFTNNGKLELTSAVDSEQAALNLNSGTLVNGAGGQINVLAGTGGGRVLGVELDNRGTVTIDQGLTLNGSSAHHLNSGTITLGSGNFTVEQNGPSPSFTTTGAISIGAGQTFTVSGGTFNYNSGTVGGEGTLRLSSTTANFTPNLSNALTTLQLNGATLNGPGSVINAVGKTLNADSSAINTALVNQGLLVFRGNAGLGGSVDNQAGATLRVQADGGYAGTATLTVASGFTNNGKLELTSAVDSEQAALNLNSGTLVNGAGGQINVLAGTGGGRVLGVELDNRGTVTIDQGLTLNGSSAHHLNSGTITLGSGNFTVEQNGPSPSFTTTGAISIGAGQTFTVSGGTFNYNTGTVGGAGTLRLSSTTANSTPNLSNALTTLQLNGATLNGPGSVINAVGKTLNADSSAINTALVNQGLLVFRGNAGLGGSVDNQAGATLRVQADGGYAGTATLTVASGFTNNGKLELTSAVDSEQAALNLNSGTLVNGAGGQINVLAGTGGGRVLGVELDNRGTVTIDQGLTLNGSSAHHLNSGTITLGSGNFTVEQNGPSPSFTTTGAISIGAGQTFTVSGGTFNYNSGTVGGEGTLRLSSTTANFTPNLSNALTTLQLNGATLNGPGSVINAVGKTLNADSSAINTALVNQGLLVFRGNAGLGGSVDNQAGATLRVQADGGYAGTATLTVASGFTNNGKLELTSAVDSEQAALNLNSGTLVNGAGGQINVLAGTGGGRVLGVELDNRGTVTIDQGLTLNGSSAHHLNSGTITLGSGNFTVEQNGPSPSFTTTGAISIGAGQTFTVSGGTFNYNTGTVGGAGTLRLSSTTANSTPNLSNALTTLQLNGATLNGPGSVINAVGKTLNADSSAINTALVNQGLLVFRGNAGLGGSVDNQAGATLRVQADGGYAGTATLTVASGFTNNGKLELTSAVDSEQAALNLNSGTLVNGAGGQINVLAGTGGGRVLGVELDNRGTVTIDQGLTLNGSSAHHLNSGTITLTGGRTFQINGGSLQVDPSGVLQGDGTLNVATTLFTNTGSINPGNPAGNLSIVGAYPQTLSGVVNIEIGGLTAGIDYDQLTITEKATLRGTLNIRLTNGFRPNAGDSFEILRYGSHIGSFDHIVGLNIGAGFLFQPVITATNVVLTTTDTGAQIVFETAKALTGGQVQFTLGGTAGLDFVIEAATNLPSPTWIPVLTNLESGASFDFIVTDTTNFPQRFFRLRQ